MTENARTGRPRSLDADDIARRALELADREGLAAVSMRRLARELGVVAMTLYGYFPDKDALLDAMVDAAVPAGALPAPADDDWRAAITGLATAVRAGLREHPALVELRLQRPIVRPEALRFQEHALRCLVAAGLAPDEAARCFRLLFTYVFGFAALSPAERSATARDQARTALAALDPEAYPALSGAADAAVDALGGDEQFRHGLDLVLDGIAARL